MKRLFLVMAVLVMLVGCGKQWAINSAELSVALISLDDQYELTSQVFAENMDSFGEAEQAQLRHADATFLQLRDSVKALVVEAGGVPQILVNAEQVRVLYDQARQSYSMVRAVVCPAIVQDIGLTIYNCKRLQQLPEIERNQILQFDANALQAHRALEAMLSDENADITQVVSDVVTIGATAARLVRIGAML